MLILKELRNADARRKRYCDWRKSMKNEEYKKLSIKEFTKAAGR